MTYLSLIDKTYDGDKKFPKQKLENQVGIRKSSPAERLSLLPTQPK